MNLGNLRVFSRISVPSAKVSRISNTNLDIMINEICRDLNARLHLLRTDGKFDVVADKQKYDLSDSDETVDKFSKIDKMGLWWNAGSASSPDWRRVIPKTVKKLDKDFPGWRNQNSADPIYYAKHGRFIITYPTAATALTSGFWLYYVENPVPMSENSDYPFGNTSEISEYSFLSKTIIKGVEAWLEKPVGKDKESTQAFAEYLIMVEDARGMLAQSLDIQSDKEARIKLRSVC